MMTIFFLVLGLLLLIAGIVDFVWTTLWVNGGAGPLTNFTASALWKFMKKVSGGNTRILKFAGPFSLALALLVWIVFLWAGWAFIFAADPAAFSDTQDGNPITWTERFYYTGYLIFTLGNGDYSPQEGIWQIATVLATATGLLFITLGVTYLLSVLGAVSQKQSFADSVSGVGKTGSEIVETAWNGEDFHDIDLLLNTYAAQLSTLTSQYNAYPVLQYYHADKPKESLPVAVTVLDEALTIFQFGIPEHLQPNNALLKEARSSVTSHLEIFKSAVNPAEHTPPLISLDNLQSAGVPTVSEDLFQLALNNLEKRRSLLLGMLEENARKWPEEAEK